MNPQLLSSLAAEHRRDLAAAATAGSRPLVDGVSAAHAARHAPKFKLPRYRVSWTRTNLAAVADNRRGRSLVIVISATRTF